MNVSELMSRQVATCRPEDALHRVAEQMWNRDCGFVVVVDETQRPTGVLTDRDICMAAWSQNRSLAEIEAGQVMARTVVTCSTDEALSAVHERARQHQLHRLPVVDGDGRITGVVALADLVRAAAASKGKTAATELLVTLAAVKRLRNAPEPTAIVPAAPKAASPKIAKPKNTAAKSKGAKSPSAKKKPATRKKSTSRR